MSIRPPAGSAGNGGVLDPDLTTIEDIDSTQTGVLASQGAGWVLRTYAQVKAALGLAKADVGLGNVDNTNDAGKPVSTAQQAALDLKAPLLSPALTGTPTAPTAATGTNTTQLATTAHVKAAIDALIAGAPGALDTLNEIAAQLASDESAASALTTVVGTKMPVVVHGSTASTARPTSSVPVFWIGTVSPTNATNNDVWVDLTTPAVKAKVSGSFVTAGSGTSSASSVTVTPTGGIASTDVQAALAELDSEKQPLDSDLTAIAALSTTSFGRSLLTAADAATARTTLGVSSVTPPPATAVDAGPGLVLHLAADSIDGVANTGAVEVWRDISGRGNHVQNTTSGQRPTLQTNQLNGKPIVRFDASDDTLMAVTASPLDKHLLKPFTFFVVLKAPDFTVDRNIWGSAGASGALNMHITTAGKLAFDLSGTAGIALNATALSAATFYVLEATYNEVGAWALFNNGTANGSGTSNQTFTPGAQHKIGSGSGLDIAEILVYDRALGSTDRSAVRALLGTKYGITVV